MLIVLTVVLILAVLYLLAIRGRRGHKGLEALRGWHYAHRGLHGEGVPENSMAAFRAAVEAGFGAELDVHLLSDGSLGVFHDGTLLRMTGKEGTPESLTAAMLSDYPLGGTEERIPLLPQVLELFAGKAPLIIELKPAKGNHAALCQATCDLLARYEGPCCLEAFDPRCLLWLKKNRPDIIRGQLSENYFCTPNISLGPVMRFLLSHMLVNFLTQPDFLAYRFADRKTLPVFLARKLWGVQGVVWTVTRPEDLETAQKEGFLSIFEGFRP